MSMSQKDYVAIARVIAEVDDLQTRKYIAEGLAVFCKKDNPRFQRSKFLDACNASDETTT